MSTFGFSGISPEQGPPLSIPLRFFFMAPVACIAGGILLLFTNVAPLASTWAPLNVAAVHITTLGFLSAVMLGATYQMLPVVAGATIAFPKLVSWVHAAFVAGVITLLWAQGSSNTTAFWVALLLLSFALLGFCIPSIAALWRAPVQSPTVTGLRIALAALACVALLGLRMSFGRAGDGYTANWNAWRVAHAAFGMLLWVGGLITAVSWQVLPMFYLAAPVNSRTQRMSLWALAFSLAATAVAAALATDPMWPTLTALPAALVVWVVHPWTAAQTLRERRRKRRDASLWFWWLGLSVAPIVLVFGAVMTLLDAPRMPIVFGWLTLWGWGGAIVHGMLSRILPFLTWFHRYAPHVGERPVPSMRQLLPDKRVSHAWYAHLTTLLVGVVAIFAQEPMTAIALGLCLLVTGLLLGRNLAGVVLYKE